MEQLLAHLVGDYILQNDYQALNKKNNIKVVLLHSILYTLPFLLITRSLLALLIICFSHAIIDGTYIIKKFNKIRNWRFNTDTGFRSDRPYYITMWLLIIQDNVIHLLINYLAIKWF